MNQKVKEFFLAYSQPLVFMSFQRSMCDVCVCGFKAATAAVQLECQPSTVWRGTQGEWNVS